MSKHRLAITVLEQKADEYHGIAIHGKYQYGDPEDEIKRWEEMADHCREAAEALKGLS